jgi:hypothetical protein
VKRLIYKAWPVFFGAGLALLTGLWLFGGLNGCLAAVRGHVACCRVTKVVDGEDEKVLTIELRNLTSAKLNILGANTNCKCATLGKISSSVSTFSTVEITATYRSSPQAVRVAFILDADSQREVSVVYDGT